MASKRVPELDGLRGMAVFLVLLHHAFPTQVYWGWIGVEMFFVLSGFLITSILLATDLTQPRALANFLARRVLRIWPVYYLALLASIAIWAAFRWHHPGPDSTVWWKCFVYLQFTEGYSTLNLSYMAHYVTWFRSSWSLAVEEQFYLVWPLLLIVVRGRRALMFVACGLFVAVCIYMRASGHALNLLLTRGDGLALGSTLAVLQNMAQTRSETFRRRLRASYAVALVVGFAAIVPYLVLGYANHAVRTYDDIAVYGDWTLNVTSCGVLFFGTIGLLSSGRIAPVRNLLRFRPLSYLGEVSYAVYMYQSLVFVVVDQLSRGLFPPHSLVPGLAGMALSIALGPLSMRYFERPIMRLKRFVPMPSRGSAPIDVADEVRQNSQGTRPS